MSVQVAFDKYAKFLENLTIEDISDLDCFVTDEVLFIDPFHQVKGVKKMSEIFIQLFEKVSNITFKIENYATNDAIVYFNWSLSGDLSGKPWDVEDVTRLKFNKKIQEISVNIQKRNFSPCKGRYCDWCDYKELLCPVFG